MSRIAHQGQVRKVRFEGPVWVGVDVHKNSYAVAVRDQEGRAVQFTMNADNDAFVRKIVSYGQPVAQVVYEAGPCGYSLYRACAAAGITALAAAPSRIPRPVTRGNKTDSLALFPCLSPKQPNCHNEQRHDCGDCQDVHKKPTEAGRKNKGSVLRRHSMILQGVLYFLLSA
jgi:hypothetical protein